MPEDTTPTSSTPRPPTSPRSSQWPRPGWLTALTEVLSFRWLWEMWEPWEPFPSSGHTGQASPSVTRAPSPTVPTADPMYLDRLAGMATIGQTSERIPGTTPECSYIGGHGPGFDSDCAWCHRARQGITVEAQAITHSAELVERHDITMPSAAVGGPNAAVEVAKLHAQNWADAHGMSVISVSPLSRSGGINGVTFDVVVGKGDISLDQRVPGVLDSWRWSGPRMEWWRRVFNRSDGRQGRVLAARDEQGGCVLPGPWRGTEALHGPLPRNQAEAATEVLALRGRTGIGCTCALGGPFVEICPVHYKADG